MTPTRRCRPWRSFRPSRSARATTASRPRACPRPELEELLGSSELGQLSEEQARRVEVHALECDACFEELSGGALAAESLRSELPAAAGLPRLPRLGPDESPARSASRRHVLFGSVAAALLIVVTLGLLAPWETGDGGGGRTRGPGDPEAMSVRKPVGAVAGPVRLDWTPVPGAREYRVRVSTSRGLTAWEATVGARAVTLPSEVREVLVPGATCCWQVEAIDAEGRLVKSALTGFTFER